MNTFLMWLLIILGCILAVFLIFSLIKKTFKFVVVGVCGLAVVAGIAIGIFGVGLKGDTVYAKAKNPGKDYKFEYQVEHKTVYRTTRTYTFKTKEDKDVFFAKVKRDLAVVSSTNDAVVVNKDGHSFVFTYKKKSFGYYQYKLEYVKA